MTFIRSVVLRITLFFLIMVPFASEAADLHAILVGDTVDWSVGAMVQVNIANMKNEINKIGNYTDLNIKMTVLTEKDYNSQLLQKLNKLSFKPDDVVVFYYSGHGYRSHSKGNPWPNIYISTEGKGIDQKAITEILKKKKPRFLLSMVNSCNSYLDGVPEVKSLRSRSLQNTILMKNNYRKLFLDTTGVIMTSSSSPGQYSWITGFGDFYTNAFISCLNDQVNGEEDPDWELLFASIIDRTWVDVKHAVGDTQTPQFEFILN